MDGVSVKSATPRRTTIDHHVLREVCGHFVTGVTVVTTATEDGPAGVTINSFTSVSLTPPLVLFCIHEQSAIWAAVRRSGRFAVNILAEDQAELCRTFARRSTARFTEGSSRTAVTGSPILADALAYLDCEVTSAHRGGDHWIVVGEVLDTAVLRGGRPLTFFRRNHPRLERLP
jgi:3-hydroxy-9,10-secoandrosta-1,3,5(10)-triene-9,17-dione monooxygenase reductase component